MKNTTTQILIDLLQDNRPLFIRFALKKCTHKEIAEDLLQSVLCKLLQTPIDFEVQNHKRLIFTMITQMYLNYYTVNKKYALISPVAGVREDVILDHLMQKNIGCTFERDLMEALDLRTIRRAANSLPNAQRQAIEKALAGKDIGDELDPTKVKAGYQPRYNSLKNNRRLAVLKLQKSLKNPQST